MSQTIPPTEKIDQEFVPALLNLIHEEYHYLAPADARTQKQSFYNTGGILFSYPDLQQMNLDIYQESFSDLQKRVEIAQLPDCVKDLYVAKFSEQQKIIDILQATSQKNDNAFHEASCKLYGTPDAKLFWFISKQIHTRFTSLIAKVDKKRKTLHQAYAVWKEYFDSLEQPSNIGVYHVPMYNGIYVPYDYEVDSAEKVYQLFSDYLTEQDINNWIIQIDQPGVRTAFGVNQATKIIHIPHDSDLSLRKKVLTKLSLQALLKHEVGVHVARRENGDASSLALLGIGLDNYLRAEEGIATLAEQLIIGANQYAGEIGYFSVGAAVGTLGNPLSFFDLYKVLHAYFILSIADKQLASEGFYELEELRMMATDQAWNRSLRTYRGSTGTTVGAAYTRDIIYLEGNKQMWRLLDSEAVIDPNWLVGKYDPTNKLHVSALRELGILPG